MVLEEVGSLLAPEQLPYLSGVERLPDGILHVAVLTRMPGVSPEMIAWWFGEYMQTTEHYRRWHPRDHVWMSWANKRPRTSGAFAAGSPARPPHSIACSFLASDTPAESPRSRKVSLNSTPLRVRVLLTGYTAGATDSTRTAGAAGTSAAAGQATSARTTAPVRTVVAATERHEGATEKCDERNSSDRHVLLLASQHARSARPVCQCQRADQRKYRSFCAS
jgi:hypothetical protein